ncbi:MAG: ABC transporter ATP-binding protein [Rhodospirillum sp.]|nr:ABC transporter ATP-binding protein [Rhodospirillum sp.]MCF8489711.1 ABC transporter ATP-binding protein [Rhodospirillum sp.]MCF8502574.1 ABC transporter ATP-binding protein [Rhodospirillum sp.]
MSANLSIQGVGRHFGGLRALSNISCEVARGECFGIIGPNGAGKTTLFNVIAGVHPPSSGEIHLGEKRLTGLSPDRVTRAGIARTFQSPNLFQDRTALENLERSRDFLSLHSPCAWLGLGRDATADKSAPDPDDILDFIGLSAQAGARASNLAYGIQKILGVGLALMRGPRVLLMDEPAAGLNPTEKVEMADLILRIRERFKLSVLVVEHDMKLIMSICDRIMVINHGAHVATGEPAKIQADQAVIDAYLGVDHELA